MKIGEREDLLAGADHDDALFDEGVAETGVEDWGCDAF